MELRYSANIVIASSGKEVPQIFETPFGEIRSRDGASLKFTTNDAESCFNRWKKKTGDYIPEDFHSLLVDPTLSQVEQTIKQLSIKLAKFPKGDPGLSLYFAGHGKQGSGDLVLKDGTLSPTRFLDLQQKETSEKRGSRGIGIILDSCYSGAFLLRLALECDRRFNEFSLYEGRVSCLPDEKSFELSSLEHGVFTYTFLNPGNKSVDSDEFNRAILEQDYPIIARGLQGAVANNGGNPTAFLTQGKQFFVSLTNYRISVPGYTEIELESKSTFEELSQNLAEFKNST